MVYQSLVLEKSSREIAQNLNVDQSTVSRTVRLFNEQGDVAKKSYPANTGTRKLTQLDQLILLELVLDKPGIYLHELQHFSQLLSVESSKYCALSNIVYCSKISIYSILAVQCFRTAILNGYSHA